MREGAGDVGMVDARCWRDRHPSLLVLANPSGASSLAARRFRSFSEMSHGLS